MNIKRYLQAEILKHLGKNKVLVITGARRVGKTFLVEHITANYNKPFVYLNGDLPQTTELLSSKNIGVYERLVGKSDLLFIDEAQVVPEIGKALKIIIDHFKNLTIIATGSSSFDLSNKVGEPLTGRQLQFHLYPIAQMELSHDQPLQETMNKLEERLIFGSYPEVISLRELLEKEIYLRDMTTSYLLKDILILENLRNSHKLLQLLQLLAYQVGHEVSYDELGKQLQLSKDTVIKYLDLLSKIFVIYRVGAYSSNLRKEIVKSSKWYFVDNGIRNAIINNFNPLTGRNDVGVLWENYLMSERLKRNACNQIRVSPHFWRTYDRQEIDLVEEGAGKLAAFEFKWRSEKAKAPIFFTKSYPIASFEAITKKNYLNFIT